MTALKLLVVSGDRPYLRFVSAVLGQAGHRAVRAPAAPGRAEPLIRLHRPDVVVLDAEGDELLVAEVCVAVLALAPATGLVLVSDGEGADAAAGVRVVSRWCTAPLLLDAVADVRPRAGGAPVPAAPSAAVAPALRLV